MFICATCNETFDLPGCTKCKSTVQFKDGIWQLSNDPDHVTSGEGDHYIGYEHIGENYSGNRKDIIDEKNYVFAKEIAKVTGFGIFLDLGCGDGCLTVPVASFGTKVIAADISNAMLKLLISKARTHHIDLSNTIICRMNALHIPISDNSVDCVVANSVLHLISNPEKVVREIYRVLKPGGVFICKDDEPGKQIPAKGDNSLYFEIVNKLYAEYWAKLDQYHVSPKKYSWTFNRDACCQQWFRSKETTVIHHYKEYTISLKDSFLPRFMARGFSDQVDVPIDLHHEVISNLLHEFRQRYGENFESTPFFGTETDFVLTKYVK